MGRLFRLPQLSPRSLIAMRVLVGLALVIEIVERLRYFSILHSQDGLFPVSYVRLELLANLKNQTWFPNIYFLHDADGFQLGLILLQALLAGMLIAGYRLRWVCPALIFLILCSNQRMFFYLKGGDVMAPWLVGLVWLMSATRDKARGFVYFLFIITAYFAAGAAKDHPAWSEGTAVLAALKASYATTALGLKISEYESFCRWMAHAVVPLEMWAPLLLLLPFRLTRYLVCALFVLFHLGLALSLHLGHLTLLMIALWVGAWPGPEEEGEKRFSIASLGLVIGILSLVFFNLNAILPSAGAARVQRQAWTNGISMGLRGDMNFYSGAPSSKAWLRFVVEEGNQASRHFDLFADRWAETPIEAEPEHVFADMIHARRFEAVFDALRSRRGQRHLRQAAKVVCARTADNNSSTQRAIVVHRYWRPMDSRVELGQLNRDVSFRYFCLPGDESKSF